MRLEDDEKKEERSATTDFYLSVDLPVDRSISSLLLSFLSFFLLVFFCSPFHLLSFPFLKNRFQSSELRSRSSPYLNMRVTACTFRHAHVVFPYTWVLRHSFLFFGFCVSVYLYLLGGCSRFSFSCQLVKRSNPQKQVVSLSRMMKPTFRQRKKSFPSFFLSFSLPFFFFFLVLKGVSSYRPPYTMFLSMNLSLFLSSDETRMSFFLSFFLPYLSK